MNDFQPPWLRRSLDPQADHSNLPTKGPALAIVTGVVGALALAIVSARLYARFIVQRKARIDDWTLLASILPNFAYEIFECYIFYGASEDRHVWDIEPSELSRIAKLTFAATWLYIVGSGLLRISVLLFYRRFGDWVISKRLKYMLNVSIVFIVLNIIVAVIVNATRSRPISALWNIDPNLPTIVSAKGLNFRNQSIWFVTAAAINTAQDFLVATLPLIALWGVQLPARQRWAMRTIFAAGYVVCVVGVLRVYYLYHVFFQSTDQTWASYDPVVWTTVELYVGMIGGSAPALKIFFRKFLSEEHVLAVHDSNGSSRGISDATEIPSKSPITGLSSFKTAFTNSSSA